MTATSPGAHRMANVELTKLEFQSLQNFHTGRTVEMHMYARLLELGLIAPKHRGYELTEMGKLHLARGK